MHLLVRINLLPLELVDFIYEYDDRHRNNYNFCVNEILDANTERENKLTILKEEVRYREYVRNWISHFSSFHKYMLNKHR